MFFPRWSERLVAGDFGDRDICTITRGSQKVSSFIVLFANHIYSLFLLQEADLLLSMVAARLRVGNGTSGNENQNQAKLSRKDLSEVQNLLMEHLITGY